jgi:hypothetical protein
MVYVLAPLPCLPETVKNEAFGCWRTVTARMGLLSHFSGWSVKGGVKGRILGAFYHFDFMRNLKMGKMKAPIIKKSVFSVFFHFFSQNTNAKR